MLDLHNHSYFSIDSNTSTEAMVLAAISKGCKIFGISEHVDFAFSGEKAYACTDYLGFLLQACTLKKKYANQISFLPALEIGYDEQVDIQKYRDLASLDGVEYVINSIHTIDGEDCYYSECFKGYTQREKYTAYLQAVLKSVKADYDYEIVGHIGYICRNAPFADPVLHYSDYSDLVDKILKEIIRKDKTIELNSSGRTCGSLFLPNMEILKRYVELGGENITFGSDAHGIDRILDKYDKACQLALEVGIKYFCTYEKKEKKYVSIKA